MHCVVKPKDIREIDPGNALQQTSFWAQVKNRHGYDPLAFKYGISKDLLSPSLPGKRYIEDDILVLIRYIDDTHCFAYVPYGPKDEPEFENQGLFLEELSEVLRRSLPRSCILIRYDLPWENQWAEEDDRYDSNGNWTGPPPVRNQEFRVNYNTRKRNLAKSPTDILPSNTIFLNLQKEKQALLNDMKPKTRYNIRLSYRKGIRVEEFGIEKLDAWYGLYRETAGRNRITLHEKAYFKTVLEAGESRNQPEPSARLLMAHRGGEYLAAMFLAISGRRGTYLFGASSSKKRNLMATYALQWEAIRAAQQSGCLEYDMFGTPPGPDRSHPLYGLQRFKSGFGGRCFHRMGCWDYPLKDAEYKYFRSQEARNPSYHI